MFHVKRAEYHSSLVVPRCDIDTFKHASCAARFGAAVILIGAPNTGKSKLLLRLLYDGYTLVGDDCLALSTTSVEGATPLNGLLERRGLGIISGFTTERATPVLLVSLGSTTRLPPPATLAGLPAIAVSADDVAAVATITLAIRCALGELHPVAGALQQSV